MASSPIELRITGEEILSHPRFPEARGLYIAECTRVYRMGFFPGQFGADAGRVTMLAIIVCLHARYVEDDRDTWPTLKRLKETVASFGFASSRLVDNFVARLAETQFLELHRHPKDSRIRLLVPTEALLSWDREWMAAHFGPSLSCYPSRAIRLPSTAARLSRKPMAAPPCLFWTGPSRWPGAISTWSSS